MLRKIGVVFAKEVLDNGRDRRSLLVAFLYPMLGPLLLGVIMLAVTDVVVSGTQENPTVHIQGAENGPELIQYLKKRKVNVITAPKDVEEAVRIGAIPAAVVIPREHGADFKAERTAKLKIIGNSSCLPGLLALNRTAGLLGEFNTEVWGQRISSRGVDCQTFKPLAINTRNVSRGVLIFEIPLFMMPPLFIFNLFMGGVYLAVNATSGERERGSLEPLLINPVSRWALMLGKFLAALFFTAMAVVVQLTAFKLIFTFVGGDAQAFENTLRPMALLAMFFMALPLMMVAVGVQLMIATVTRSFKEAQTYFGLLPLVPAIPGMAMVFSPVQTQKWMMTIPIFSQTLIMGQYVRDEDVELINLAYSASFTGLLALVLIYISSRLYERENLISAAELSISWATSFRL